MGKADTSSATTLGKEKSSDTSVPTEDTEQKEDVENLRKVIKLNEDNLENDEEKPEEPGKDTKDNEDDMVDDVKSPVSEIEKQGPTTTLSSRDELEQKRTILQRIKDFDFQIRKNQQDISAVSDKMHALSKDLDDLVSLYEIVSEQMNPFVGLSKVTKKRLESLENITKEVDALKEKLSMIEIERNNQTVQNAQVETIEPSFDVNLSDQDINQIIELSFMELAPEATVEDRLDYAIDVFIENLKAGNVN